MCRKSLHTLQFLILLFGMSLMMSSCQEESLSAVETQKPVEGPVAERSMVQLDFTASLSGEADTRVFYNPAASGGNTQLKLSWGPDEVLGVYIKQADNNIIYAGIIEGSGSSGTTSRLFTGKVLSKQEREEYLFLHPVASGEAVGQSASGSISFNNTQASIGGTSHLNSAIPLLWKELSARPNYPAEYKGFVIDAHLQFATDPGKIQSVTLQTMENVGVYKIFPTSFSTATMAGTSLSQSITVNISAEDNANILNKTLASGLYEGDVYIPCCTSSADVFRSKYNLKVVTTTGEIYYSNFLSFPGQESATVDQHLAMLDNGKCYNLTAQMSKGYAPTVISAQYKVNSLLGMWNQYGKAYDPQHLIVYSGEGDLPTSLPSQLKENKNRILTRYLNNGPGTPTFLGTGSNSIYELGRPDVKQADVTYNNITITEETEVFVTFISEFGWNENLLGYYHYPSATTPSSGDVTKTLIFPNVSKPNHQPFNLEGSGSGNTTSSVNIGTPDQAPLREYETVKLLYTDAKGFTSSVFPAGTTIGFFMMIDTEAQEQTPNAGYDLLKWSQWRLFTNSAWNKENTKWSSAYANDNFFASGDVCNGSEQPIPGLAIYGVKDNATNIANTAYGAMIFMVSTSNPDAMQTQNTAYFNIGDGDAIVIAKP